MLQTREYLCTFLISDGMWSNFLLWYCRPVQNSWGYYAFVVILPPRCRRDFLSVLYYQQLQFLFIQIWYSQILYLHFQDAAAMHYHFLIVWRLLACLPPSSQFLDLLSSGTVQLANGNILHTLRVAPRLGQKTYFTWMLVSAHVFANGKFSMI